MKPVIILLTGLPGSGKSFYARSYSSKLNTLVVSSERIRATLLGKDAEERDVDFTEQEELQVYELMYYFFLEAVDASKSIILDGVFRSNYWRMRFEKAAREKMIPFIGIHLTCSERLAFERMKARKEQGTTSPAGPAAYQTIKEVFEQPPEYYEVIVNEGGPVRLPPQIGGFPAKSK